MHRLLTILNVVHYLQRPFSAEPLRSFLYDVDPFGDVVGVGRGLVWLRRHLNLLVLLDLGFYMLDLTLYLFLFALLAPKKPLE